MKYKVIVFDLGGTLMEYVGMPHSWVGYYRSGFDYVNRELKLNLSDVDISKAVQVLTDYNPRVNPREIEYSSEFLFKRATVHISFNAPLKKFIDTFFSGLTLKSKIYDDTFEVIEKLKAKGYKIAGLTNLPSSMPDRLFVKDIKEVLIVLDLYVSSETCGFRKPNPRGLHFICNKLGVKTSDLIFVGDEKLDIETSKRMGCDSIYIDRKCSRDDFKQTYTINNLTSVLEFL